MPKKPEANEETVIKEYPKSTQFVVDKRVIASGNLILTNRRLAYLREVELDQKEIADLQKLGKEASTEQLIQFALGLHKKNLQIALSSIVRAKLGFYSIFPIPRTYMRVYYKTTSRKENMLIFQFTQPFLKRIMMSRFPTLEFISAINKAVKAQKDGKK